MTTKRLVYNAAACSWIDPKTELPENDIPIVGTSVNRAFLTGESGYRFCNFTQIWAKFDSKKKRVVECGFDPVSGVYRSPSFLKIPSHIFPVIQSIQPVERGFDLIQTTGARTVTGEVIGGIAGAAVTAVLLRTSLGLVLPLPMAAGLAVGTLSLSALGGMLGSLAATKGAIAPDLLTKMLGSWAGPGDKWLNEKSNFPPIWSTIRVSVRDDETITSQLLRYSIFPSLSFYRQEWKTIGDKPRNILQAHPVSNGAYYDATKMIQLPKWQSEGWGSLPSLTEQGPTRGNPWDMPAMTFGTLASRPTF